MAEITFDGLTADDILSLPDTTLRATVLHGRPLVFRVGTADVLGRFATDGGALIVELGHVDGGGEGVLPAIAALARRYAVRSGLTTISWRVHAVTCRRPNERLRRLLVRRGFQLIDEPATGPCYALVSPVRPD